MTRAERKKQAAERRAEWQLELHNVIRDAVIKEGKSVDTAMAIGRRWIQDKIFAKPQLKSELMASAIDYMHQAACALKDYRANSAQ